MDTLSLILDDMHFDGVVFASTHNTAPWAWQLATPGLASFHIVTSGQAWLMRENLPPHLDPDRRPARATCRQRAPHTRQAANPGRARRPAAHHGAGGPRDAATARRRWRGLNPHQRSRMF
ncbi:MAG: cupin domain-containing protein [Aquabacterium sp.]|nr:cupin domain-containing protein [Aquabacterium sp.]